MRRECFEAAAAGAATAARSGAALLRLLRPEDRALRLVLITLRRLVIFTALHPTEVINVRDMDWCTVMVAEE